MTRAARKRPSAQSLRRILELARPEWRRLAVGTVALAVGSAMALSYPQAVRLIVDQALAGKDLTFINQAALAMVAIALVQGVATAIRFYAFSTTGERTVSRLRRRVYENLLTQEVAFFDERRTGELTNRLSSDASVLQSAVSANISMALRNAAQVLGGVALLAVTSPSLTLLMLAVVPPVALGAVAYGRRVRKLAREVQDALARSNEVAEESLSGIRTVRSFAAEAAEAKRYGQAIDQSYELARQRAAMASTFMAGAGSAAFIAAAVVLWYGGRLIVEGAMTVGGLTSFLIYTMFVAMALASLSDLWAELMKASGAAERIFELMDRAPVIPARGGLAPGIVRGEVSFQGVHFAYPSRRDTPVLKGLDLTLRAGEVVALVGPSGAGKSTVAALLSRLYDPDLGRISLDGHDLRALDPEWLRRQVGVVSQEPLLFSCSIADNIRYARPEATEAEVEAAARTANAHAFIAKFPDGYRTQVGERGVQLSGGQRQRVAIARAVLKDPKILVLDEATSALDAESEHLVQEALERLMQNRTTLIIAHRLSTVVNANRVVVLEGGAVVQSGTHRALLEQEGLYRKLVERQFVAA